MNGTPSSILKYTVRNLPYRAQWERKKKKKREEKRNDLEAGRKEKKRKGKERRREKCSTRGGFLEQTKVHSLQKTEVLKP